MILHSPAPAPSPAVLPAAERQALERVAVVASSWVACHRAEHPCRHGSHMQSMEHAVHRLREVRSS